MVEQFRAHEHRLHLTGRQQELTELYAASALRNFAAGLLFVFEPIYIYLLFGKSLPHTFFFFGLAFIATALLVPFAGRALARWGVKHSMLASTPFAILYFVGLWHASALGPLVMLLPLALAMHDVLYWPAFHIDFVLSSTKRDRAKQMSTILITVALAAAAAPLLGGFIVQEVGFSALFALVVGFFFISTIPLFLSREVHGKSATSYLASVRQVASVPLRKKTAAFVAEGFDAILTRFVWPLFLFLIAVNFEELGMITSGVLFLGIISTFIIGRVTDKHGTEKMLRLGAGINAILWPARAFVSTPFSAFLTDLGHQVGRSMALIPFVGAFYNWAGETPQDREGKVLSRAIALNAGAGIILFLLAILTTFTDDLRVLFWLGPLSAAGLLLISEHPLPAWTRFGRSEK
jgi:MFS family permease